MLVTLGLAALAAHAWYGLRNHFFDLMIYREAMRWWADGHPLYDYARPDATQGDLEFTYPPVGAFLLLPLAWLTQAQARCCRHQPPRGAQDARHTRGPDGTARQHLAARHTGRRVAEDSGKEDKALGLPAHAARGGGEHLEVLAPH